VVLAHLKALETRHDPADRRAWKVRLVRGLYERGLDAEDVRQLFRFIDWVMDLPQELDDTFWQEIAQIQETKRMPFITTPERVGRKAGYLKGLEIALRVKFGDEVLGLLPELRELHDHELLEAVLEAIPTVSSPEQLRRVWTRKRRSKKGRPKE
jgi:hypothetical protein